jgi:hypothetical protein
VSSISPTSGPSRDCQKVKIRGAGFDARDLVAVDFGGAAATDVRVVDSHTIVVRAPSAHDALSTGTGPSVDVGIFQLGGTAVAAMRYTYDSRKRCQDDEEGTG